MHRNLGFMKFASVYLRITDSSQLWRDTNFETRISKCLIIFQPHYYRTVQYYRQGTLIVRNKRLNARKKWAKRWLTERR